MITLDSWVTYSLGCGLPTDCIPMHTQNPGLCTASPWKLAKTPLNLARFSAILPLSSQHLLLASFKPLATGAFALHPLPNLGDYFLIRYLLSLNSIAITRIYGCPGLSRKLMRVKSYQCARYNPTKLKT
jgi:hypothetical protein